MPANGDEPFGLFFSDRSGSFELTAVRARGVKRAYAWFMDMLASLWLMAAVTMDFVFPGSKQSLRSEERHSKRVRLPAHWRRW